MLVSLSLINLPITLQTDHAGQKKLSASNRRQFSQYYLAYRRQDNRM